jgi:rhodanese-related sulfurtransferase
MGAFFSDSASWSSQTTRDKPRPTPRVFASKEVPVSQAPVCVRPEELQGRVKDALVVDVRTPGEFESVHIPHSRNLPLDEIEQHADQLRREAEAGREVVLVCRSGSRAHQAQERLEAAGLGTLPILEGGMVGWQHDGGEVVQDVIRWDLERQVRLVAGSIVLLSILVSLVWPPARFVAGFVGAGLVFAAITNTCGMAMMLSKLPYNQPKNRQADGESATASA